MSSIPTTAELPYARARLLAGRVPLVAIFAFAALAGCLESAGHRLPLVFSDELLYAKFAQSISAGHGLSIWGVHQFFPSPLAPAIQSPAWLLGSVGDAYLAARILNAVVMASAAFPAYWLARRLVRQEWALLSALAAVAVPELAYHDTLMAEPLAYPLFLLTAAAVVRAVADGGRWLRLLAVVLCALTVATRLQLAAVVVAYALAAIVCSGRRRSHLLPLAVLLVPPAVALALRGHAVLGQYNGFVHLHAGSGALAHWIGLIAMLLPFSFGLAVLPGSLLGLVARPRDRAEAAFAVFTVAFGAIALAEAGLVAAGDAQRVLTRYVFYLAPLLVIAFFLYVERGAPHRLVYVALAAAGGIAASRIPFAELTAPGLYDNESTVATAFATLEERLGTPRATLAIELGVLAVALVVALVPLRRAWGPLVVSVAGISVSLLLGTLFVQADHRTTRTAAATLAPRELDWIDRARLGPVTYLSLPASLVVPDSEVEFWNRSVRRVAQFSNVANGALPLAHAQVSAAGRLEIAGKPNPAGRFVLGAWGSRIGIDGRRLGRSGWLTAMELPANARVRWLAAGLDRNGWSGPTLTYTVWPQAPRRGGSFVLQLALPSGEPAKSVRLAVTGGVRRTISIAPGKRVSLVLPAGRSTSLTLTVRGPRPGLREHGVEVERISYR
ncbi:MAG TPA: glycosyltransferase family 39 protein [Gaiellaceae bacterium]|jgi:hypothetical protein